MSVTANTLRELHRIHRQLADLRERLDRGPKQIKAHEQNVLRLETSQQEAKDTTQQARMQADQKQLQLKTGETKILDLRTKLNTCNSNREYQALLEQIAGDEMTNSVLEDEILEALDKIEQLQVAVGEADKHGADGRVELEKTRTSVAEAAELIKGDIARLESELSEIETSLPDDFRMEYQRFVRAKGDEAMAAVKDNCCSGCYQQITPNMISELTMGRIAVCTACGRMLYLPEDRSIGS